MKKIIFAAAVAVIGIAISGSAMAGIVNPLVNVTATVLANCTYIAPGALTIIIDPALSGPQNMTATQPQVKCTKNRTVAISAASLGSGSNSATGTLVGLLKQVGFTDIPYTFTFASSCVGNGFGSVADLAINIAGSVSETDAQAAAYAAGSYTDTVTLTVTY